MPDTFIKVPTTKMVRGRTRKTQVYRIIKARVTYLHLPRLMGEVRYPFPVTVVYSRRWMTQRLKKTMPITTTIKTALKAMAGGYWGGSQRKGSQTLGEQ